MKLHDDPMATDAWPRGKSARARDTARGDVVDELSVPSRNGHAPASQARFEDGVDWAVEAPFQRDGQMKPMPPTDEGQRTQVPRPEGVPPEERAATPQLDLLTVAMLAPWIEEGIKKVGRSRLKKIVDVYVTMQGITLEVRDTVQTMISLDNTQEPSGAVPIAESMRLLAELDLVWSRKGYREDAGRALLAAYFAGKQRAG